MRGPRRQRLVAVATLGSMTALLGLASPAQAACLVLEPRSFVRATGAPVTESVSFARGGHAGPFQLVVRNGDARGGSRASSATITLNGVKLFGPASFNQQVATLEATVDLQSSNTLAVHLASAPGSTLTVEIADLDTTAPQVTLQEPAQGAFIGRSPLQVRGSVDDSTATVTVNGQAVAVSAGTFSTSIPIAQPLTPTRTITARATDLCGNVGEASATVNLDTVPPTVAITYPPAGLATRGDVTPTVSASDNYAVQSTTIVVDQLLTAPDVAITTEGFHRIEASARDFLGNTASATPVDFVIDRTGAACDVSGTLGPGGNPYRNTDVSPLVVITDALSGVAASSVAVNGVPFVPGTTYQLEGTYQLECSALDHAGNTSSFAQTFYIDRTDPATSLLGVTEGARVLGPVLLMLAVMDASPTTSVVRVDGALQQPGPFAPISELGPHTVEVTTTDAAGNTATLVRTFTIIPNDTTPPAIVFLNVTDGQCEQNGVTPGVSIQDESETTFSASLNGVPFVVGSSIIAEGLYKLRIVATDAAGNVAEAAISFRVDRTGPETALLGFEDGELRAGAVTVTTQIADASPYTLHLWLDGAARPSGTTLSGAGPHTAEVLVIDCAGNLGHAAGAFAIVTAAPTLSVELPLDGQVIQAETTTVAGQVTDPYFARLTVAGTEVVPDAEGRFSTTVPVGPGLTSISIVATNGAGLSTTASRRVLQVVGGTGSDPAVGGLGLPTFIKINMGQNQTGIIGRPLPVALIVRVTDAAGEPVPAVPVTFMPIAGSPSFLAQEGAIIDDTGATVPTDASGFASIGVILSPSDSDERILATFPGYRGLPPIFIAHPVPPPAAGDPTRLTGIVYDEEFKPVPGVTVEIHDAGLATTTGPDGRFRFSSGVPTGRVTVHLRGDTATVPGKTYPPSLPVFFQVVAGIENRQDGPLFLPAIDTSSFLDVSPTQGGVLRSSKLPGLELEVGPGQYTFPDGSKAGRLFVSVIEPQNVPMALPNGLFSMKMISIAPGGGTFNPPARLTTPNVNNLPPGAQTLMYSYSHRFQDWDLLGTGTVTADAISVVSDPGVGIKESAWHGDAPTRPCPKTICKGNAAAGCECRCNDGSGRIPPGTSYIQVSECSACPPVITLQCTCCTSDADCNDDKKCTIDKCVRDPKPHCENKPINPDDGNDCNGKEVCCEDGSSCDDGNPCTSDACVGNRCEHQDITPSTLAQCTECGQAKMAAAWWTPGAPQVEVARPVAPSYVEELLEDVVEKLRAAEAGKSLALNADQDDEQTLQECLCKLHKDDICVAENCTENGPAELPVDGPCDDCERCTVCDRCSGGSCSGKRPSASTCGPSAPPTFDPRDIGTHPPERCGPGDLGRTVIIPPEFPDDVAAHICINPVDCLRWALRLDRANVPIEWGFCAYPHPDAPVTLEGHRIDGASDPDLTSDNYCTIVQDFVNYINLESDHVRQYWVPECNAAHEFQHTLELPVAFDNRWPTWLSRIENLVSDAVTCGNLDGDSILEMQLDRIEEELRLATNDASDAQEALFGETTARSKYIDCLRPKVGEICGAAATRGWTAVNPCPLCP